MYDFFARWPIQFQCRCRCCWPRSIYICRFIWSQWELFVCSLQVKDTHVNPWERFSNKFYFRIPFFLFRWFLVTATMCMYRPTLAVPLKQFTYHIFNLLILVICLLCHHTADSTRWDLMKWLRWRLANVQKSVSSKQEDIEMSVTQTNEQKKNYNTTTISGQLKVSTWCRSRFMARLYIFGGWALMKVFKLN